MLLQLELGKRMDESAIWEKNCMATGKSQGEAECYLKCFKCNFLKLYFAFTC